jgi:molybdenum cofactor biosynthesis protein B
VSVSDHRRYAPASIGCFVLTISDTRTEANDTSGQAIAQALEQAGHQVAGRLLLRDDPEAVRDAVLARVGTVDRDHDRRHGPDVARQHMRSHCERAATSGSTGSASSFGPSASDIGSAMLSRACAGTIGRTAIFLLPGAEDAVRLAMSRLILPELGHIVRELRR